MIFPAQFGLDAENGLALGAFESFVLRLTLPYASGEPADLITGAENRLSKNSTAKECATISWYSEVDPKMRQLAKVEPCP